MTRGRLVQSMALQHLLDGLNVHPVGEPACDVTICDVTDDSRRVRPASLYIARSSDPAHTAQAVEQGAVAVVTASTDPPPAAAAVAWYRADQVGQPLAGAIAERFYDHPSRKLKLIGVTGTNGKTTTAFIIQHLLADSGVSCGMIGTVWIDDGHERRVAELTTPGAVELSRLLAEMVDHDCRAVVVEVSSHALHQGRTAALLFNTAVFTNLSGDHLDYHDTIDDYAAAKAVLFEQLNETGWAVVNAEDPYALRMVEKCKAQQIWCHVGEAAVSDDTARMVCNVDILELAADHSRSRFNGPWGHVEAKLPLVGRYNVANALQAVAAAHTINPLTERLCAGIQTCPAVPGRLESVRINDEQKQPVVLVDYAHTHDALENVLTALRPLAKGKLIVVFGCGGDRDRTKRPKMAAAACRYADQVVVTCDNPRTEQPQQIIDDILTGVPDAARQKVTVQADRAAAIATAVTAAEDDDTVLIAGKGHEDYQIIGTTKRHFDDREQAATALRHRAEQIHSRMAQ